MTIKEALKNYSEININDDNEWYHWNLDEKKLPLAITLPGGSLYKKNISLKKVLNEKWMNSDKNEKEILIKYYISTWGGIHTNSAKKMKYYSESDSDELISNGSKGIASWSKALCIHNPEKYAIFDARVSISLNALQIISNVEKKLFFPVLTSRNTVIKEAIKRANNVAKEDNWKNSTECTFYKNYLALLEEVSKKLKTKVYSIEMLLFAKAEELSKEAYRIKI